MKFIPWFRWPLRARGRIASVGQTLVATGLLAALVPSALAADAAKSTTAEDEPVELAAVGVVAGSNLRTRLAADQNAIPIDIIDLKSFRSQGATTVQQTLINQPYVSGTADNSSRAGAVNNAEVNLRGLGAAFTLTLTNGRRTNRTNLNLMPLIAVQRVEVVKDGASSVYGSDAMTGVVNLVTRTDFEGFEISSSYGNSFTDGNRDAGSVQVSALVGVKSKTTRLVAAAQWDKQNSITVLDNRVSYTDNYLALFSGPDRRVRVWNPALINVPGTGLVTLNPSFAPGQTGASPSDYVSTTSTSQNRLTEKTILNDVINEAETASYYGSLEHDVFDRRLTFFGQFLYRTSKTYYPDDRGWTVTNLTVPANNYWNPFKQQVTLTSYSFEKGGTPGRPIERPREIIIGDQDSTFVYGGVKGTISKFDYEFSYSRGAYIEDQTHNGVSLALLNASLAKTDASAINVFGNAAATAAQINPLVTRFKRTLVDSYVSQATALVRASPVTLPGGDLQVSVGYEAREQKYNQTYDAALAISRDDSSISFLNNTSLLSPAERANALFGEAEIPVLSAKQNVPFVSQLSVGAAYRQDRSAIYGKARTPRYLMRWVPLPDESLMFRFSYAEAFVPPTAQQRDGVATNNQNSNVSISDPRILGASGAPLSYGIRTFTTGNPNVQPTTGKYYNAGVVFSPKWLKGFSSSVDYWKLMQDNSILSPTVANIINGLVPGIIVRDSALTAGDTYSGAPVGRIISVTPIPVNVGVRLVEGIDFNASYGFSLGGYGRMVVGSYNTYTRRFYHDNKDGVGRQNDLGVRSIFGANPRFRSTANVNWTRGSWAAFVGGTYIGAYRDPAISTVFRQNIYFSFDANLSYTTKELGIFGGALDRTSLSVGIRNMFDRRPPFQPSTSTGYPVDVSYVDPRGRVATITLRKTF